MSKSQRLASFCRLCLSKTKDKVPVFSDDNLLDGLLRLVEIEIDSKEESDAIVCYDCVVTLEGFHQFKEQCHVNDEFIKSLPPKIDSSMSAADSDDEDVEEEEEDGGGYVHDDIDEIDHLEPSEEDEMVEPIVPEKKRSSKSSPKKGVKTETKKSPPKGKKFLAIKEEPKKSPERKRRSTRTPLEMPQLEESYPDYFYFEKGPRSIYYTLVFYGERYNSALYNERNTTWQCIHRRKYQCSAQVWASHDYQNFERHNEHTHGPQLEKEGKIFTPLEALPDVFNICYNILMNRRIQNNEVRMAMEKQKPGKRPREEGEVSDDSDVEQPVGYEPGEYISEEEPQSSKKSSSKKQKKQPASKKQESLLEALGQDEPLAEYEDLERIEAECEALNIPRKPSQGPSLDEMLVLADEYPDFFYFEKGPRSVYYSLIFYGERFHSALFTEHYTYWQCHHRRKYKCPAVVAVTNDYKTFERRYEHSHEDIPYKEGIIYTPREALPEIFNACRRIVCKNRARRRQKLLLKYKYLKSLNDSTKPELIEMEEYSGVGDSLTELMMKSGVYEDEEILDDEDVVEEVDED